MTEHKEPPVQVKFEDGTRELHFDLRSPCEECPFRSDKPIYPGLIGEAPEMAISIIAGRFAHTCHRTDPRSDYEPAKDYDGKLQHCAGALVMMTNDNECSTSMYSAIVRGRFDPSKLNLKAPVMTMHQLFKRVAAAARELAHP